MTGLYWCGNRVATDILCLVVLLGVARRESASHLDGSIHIRRALACIESWALIADNRSLWHLD